MELATPEPRLQPQSRFLSLPLELVLDIISKLSDDRNTLCALATTCRLVHPFSEDHIYSSIELHSTDDLEAICHAFRRRRSRIDAVQSLKILYKYHSKLADTENDRIAFNASVKDMKALQELHIESPFDNFKWTTSGGARWVEQDMECFRTCLETASLRQSSLVCAEVGLAKLKKLIIHSHGSDCDFWKLGQFHCLFRHPSLRFLHVSCVSLPDDLPELKDYANTTPLHTLIFDECELIPASLLRILSTPKALKHLTLGENVANIRDAEGPAPRLTSDPQAAMQALQPVAHSLETLVHLDPTQLTYGDPSMALPPIKVGGNGLREFHNLHDLTCHPCSFLYRGAITWPAIAPPKLQNLRLRRSQRFSAHGYDWFHELPQVPSYKCLPCLKVLEFIETTVVANRYAPEEIAEYICTPTHLQERHTYAYKLWKAGIGVKVYAEVSAKRSYIPPFLYGEPLPQLIPVYDSLEVGFHRQTDEAPPQPHHQELFRGILPTELEDDLSTNAMLAGTQTPPSAQEPVETDHLRNIDMNRLRNEVHRRLERYHHDLRTHHRANSDFSDSDIDDDFSDDLLEDEDDDEDDDMGMFLGGVDFDPDEMMEEMMEGLEADFDYEDALVEAIEDYMAEGGVQMPGFSLQEMLDLHGSLGPEGVEEAEDDDTEHDDDEELPALEEA